MVAFVECNVAQLKQRNNIEYKDISSCLDLNVVFELAQDTVTFNDEISFKILFRNKTDTSFYFRPDALLSLIRELPNGIYVHDINFTFLSIYSDINNLILIEPHGIYSKTYKVIIEKPWCISGKNELYVMYACRAGKGKKQKQQYEAEQKWQHEVLYGSLRSPVFEIFVKEK
jgi:hypothetical protein